MTNENILLFVFFRIISLFVSSLWFLTQFLQQAGGLINQIPAGALAVELRRAGRRLGRQFFTGQAQQLPGRRCCRFPGGTGRPDAAPAHRSPASPPWTSGRCTRTASQPPAACRTPPRTPPASAPMPPPKAEASRAAVSSLSPISGAKATATDWAQLYPCWNRALARSAFGSHDTHPFFVFSIPQPPRFVMVDENRRRRPSNFSPGEADICREIWYTGTRIDKPLTAAGGVGAGPRGRLTTGLGFGLGA